MALGQCQGPYGLKGDIKVKPYSGETAHFRKLVGTTVELRKDGKIRQMVVTAASEYGPMALVRFQGIDSPEALHPLAMSELWADRAMGAPLGKGEFYISDLIGLELRYQGQCLAVVKAVWENSTGDMLDVAKPDGSRANVPFRDPFVGEVHKAEGWIDLLIDWVLE